MYVTNLRGVFVLVPISTLTHVYYIQVVAPCTLYISQLIYTVNSLNSTGIVQCMISMIIGGH
jgi:hypothetical protein